MLRKIISSLAFRAAVASFHPLPRHPVTSFYSPRSAHLKVYQPQIFMNLSTTTMSLSTLSISETYAALRKTVKSRKTHSLEWREAQLRGMLKMLDEHHDEFISALNKDLGRSKFLSELSELAQLKASVKDTIGMLQGYTKPTGRLSMFSMPKKFFPATGCVIPEPLGLVLIIAPWNYPINLALTPLVGAIAAGNAVLLKPSEVSSFSSKVMAELVPKYLDQEAIRVIEGGVDETTEILSHKFDHIFYTGSTTVGRIVYKAAAQHLTPVTLELGGKSPVLIDDTANLKLSARRILFAKFLNCGQICIAPDYVLVTKDNASAFYYALKETYDELFPEPLESTEEYARIINDAQTQRLVSYLNETDQDEVIKRGKILCGGDSNVAEKYIGITAFQNTSLDAKIMQDEIFGPLLPIVEVESMDDAIDIVNDKEKPLALYLFTSNQALIDKVTQQTSSGAISINECVMHFAVEDLPFGGVGESGMGCYHGRSSFETFSHMKTMFHQSDRSILDPPFRYPPYTDRKKHLMRKFF